MSEMFNIINENADAAREAALAERARRAELRIKKANRSFIRRGVIAGVLVLAAWLLGFFGLVHWGLSVAVVSAASVWFAVWLGAWMQFRFGCWGGLLK